MDERILILGADGYIGWNLMMSLGNKNNGAIMGVDNFSRRDLVAGEGGESLTPIRSIKERISAYEDIFGKKLDFEEMDVENSSTLKYLLKNFKPSTIINLAQMPSAPYSMKQLENAKNTFKNNVLGNLTLLWSMKDLCPDAHLIKMGTMGEYGTPNLDIPEGFFEIEYNGRKDTLPFPKQAGSFYHWAKVAESQHTMFTSKVWGLRATDMMQGVLFGVNTAESKKDERLISRFDYDGVFGTVINRFVVQTMSEVPLTPYGKGEQTRGFLNIKDAMKCFELYIKNPAEKGEYRVFNQLAEQSKDINGLAEMVAEIGNKKGYNSKIEKISNPRVEMESHYYNVEASKLKKIGLVPHSLEKEVEFMFDDLKPYIGRIIPSSINPQINWK